MAIYGVPSTQSVYLNKVYASCNRATATSSVDISLKVNINPEVNPTVFTTKLTYGLTTSGTSYTEHDYGLLLQKFEGPCVVKVEATTSASATDVSAGFNGIVL